MRAKTNTAKVSTPPLKNNIKAMEMDALRAHASSVPCMVAVPKASAVPIVLATMQMEMLWKKVSRNVLRVISLVAVISPVVVTSLVKAAISPVVVTNPAKVAISPVAATSLVVAVISPAVVATDLSVAVISSAVVATVPSVASAHAVNTVLATTPMLSTASRNA